MNIAQIEQNLQDLVKNFDQNTFIYDLIRAYDVSPTLVKRIEQGNLNLSKIEGEILWKAKLFFKIATAANDIDVLFAAAKNHIPALKNKARFVVVTDYQQFMATDTKTGEEIACTIAELPQHFDFFLPWAGMEKAQAKFENPADVKAAERMAKLFDEIKKDNPTTTPEEVHNLNVFLSRLLFCFFAEDTGIFEQKNQFTRAIESHTQEDGSDLAEYLDKLFVLMNTPDAERSGLPKYLSEFPYVNGGLFRNPHTAPIFTKRSRNIVVQCGDEDWSAINPDIFGSMMQAVISTEYRGGMGMHYTSVPNIMKVIEPLFMDELRAALEDARGNLKKLQSLRARLANIKIFDPACGSGNFLIIAYKELRQLEIEIFKAINNMKGTIGSGTLDFGNNEFSEISLNNFYGIELDDFAHELAILSLWIVEHQMNQVFFQAFGRSKPPLPLLATGNILQGNACRIAWESVCPKNENDEIYILGNPPYLGSSNQNTAQKEDMALVFKEFNDYKKLDYIAAWFLKGAKFIRDINAQFAFVSTNSICQGEQVSLLWQLVLSGNQEINFAYQSFKWENNAKSNAAVIVVIVGIGNKNNKTKKIYQGNLFSNVQKINPYLVSGNTTYISRQSESISKLANLVYGSMPNDGGNLIFSTEEKSKLLIEYPNAKKFIKKFIGAHDFLNGGERWCLFIQDEFLNEANNIDEINKRLSNITQIRSKSTEKSTRLLAETPHKYYFSAHENTDSLIIPRHSSERREYIPMGFLTEETVIADSSLAIYNPQTWLFAVLTSKMHMAWIKAVGGRLKTDYRYSSGLCYNTFPFPSITSAQKTVLEDHVYNILGERENHRGKTLAELYDPEKMPTSLREAHRMNDIAVEQCYRMRPFESDEERLEYLFKLYEKMIAEEKERGTLFAKEKKGKKK